MLSLSLLFLPRTNFTAQTQRDKELIFHSRMGWLFRVFLIQTLDYSHYVQLKEEENTEKTKNHYVHTLIMLLKSLAIQVIILLPVSLTQISFAHHIETKPKPNLLPFFLYTKYF